MHVLAFPPHPFPYLLYIPDIYFELLSISLDGSRESIVYIQRMRTRGSAFALKKTKQNKKDKRLLRRPPSRMSRPLIDNSESIIVSVLKVVSHIKHFPC